jgi:hypothetical protein
VPHSTDQSPSYSYTLLSKDVLLIIYNTKTKGKTSKFLASFPSEGVKKLAQCGSANRVGRPVQALEGGSLDVMGNLRFQ